MREKLSAWSEKHPILFVLVPMALYLIYMTPFQMMKATVTNYWFMAAVEVVPALAAAWLTHKLGWWRETGLLGRMRWRSLWVIILPSAFIVLNFHGVGVSLSNLIAGAVLTFLIGFEEEAFSRGIYLQVLTRRYGLMGGALLTSAMFGLGHLHNLLGGAPLLGVLVQVVMAMAIGWMYVAVRLRTNSLWPAIIVHMLTDFSAFIGGSVQVQDESGSSALVGVIVAVVLFGYGYLTLRGLARGAAGNRSEQKVG